MNYSASLVCKVIQNGSIDCSIDKKPIQRVSLKDYAYVACKVANPRLEFELVARLLFYFIIRVNANAPSST